MHTQAHASWRRAQVLLVAALTPPQALAHPGAGGPSDFIYGLVHPFSGLDHVLAMLGVGLLAWLLGGKSLWRVPLTFIGIMAASAMAAAAQIALPWVESAIALSVLGTGALLACGRNVPHALALPVVAVFAGFHGYAHGAGMPVGASALTFAAGFMVATAVLHGAGLLTGAALGRLGHLRDLMFTRVAGVAMSVTGALLLVGTA